MKAAVLHAYGTIPRYEDFPDPVPANEQQVLINVHAASIKQIDKSRAAGRHYTTYASLPAVVGLDGAGILEDGTKVYAGGITGMMAEKALILKDSAVVLPGNIDLETAAALPNPLLGADAALMYKSGFKKGDTVLINGATGVSGKLAVQVAKYRGAAVVIATGRNAATLEQLKTLGADEIISLQQTDEAIISRLKQVHQHTPVDIVLDYLWAHPMELILAAFKTLPPHKIKIVTIGEMAGASIHLASGILRSTQIELIGSGIGSISIADITAYMKSVLPEMFQLAAAGKLKLDIETAALKDVESAWQKDAGAGKRMVIKI